MFKNIWWLKWVITRHTIRTTKTVHCCFLATRNNCRSIPLVVPSLRISDVSATPSTWTTRSVYQTARLCLVTLQNNSTQQRQCMYNVTLRRVRETTLDVEKQSIRHICVCVCVCVCVRARHKMWKSLHVKYTYFSFRILIKIEFSWPILEKSSNATLYQNPFNGSPVVPCGRTDRRTGKRTWQR